MKIFEKGKKSKGIGPHIKNHKILVEQSLISLLWMYLYFNYTINIHYGKYKSPQSHQPLDIFLNISIFTLKSIICVSSVRMHICSQSYKHI